MLKKVHVVNVMTRIRHLNRYSGLGSLSHTYKSAPMKATTYESIGCRSPPGYIIQSHNFTPESKVSMSVAYGPVHYLRIPMRSLGVIRISRGSKVETTAVRVVNSRRDERLGVLKSIRLNRLSTKPVRTADLSVHLPKCQVGMIQGPVTAIGLVGGRAAQTLESTS